MSKLRMEIYDFIAKNQGKIMQDIAAIPEKLMPKEYIGRLVYSGGSGNPPPVARGCCSMESSSRRVCLVASLDVK